MQLKSNLNQNVNVDDIISLTGLNRATLQEAGFKISGNEIVVNNEIGRVAIDFILETEEVTYELPINFQHPYPRLSEKIIADTWYYNEGVWIYSPVDEDKGPVLLLSREKRESLLKEESVVKLKNLYGIKEQVAAEAGKITPELLSRMELTYSEEGGMKLNQSYFMALNDSYPDKSSLAAYSSGGIMVLKKGGNFNTLKYKVITKTIRVGVSANLDRLGDLVISKAGGKKQITVERAIEYHKIQKAIDGCTMLIKQGDAIQKRDGQAQRDTLGVKLDDLVAQTSHLTYQSDQAAKTLWDRVGKPTALKEDASTFRSALILMRYPWYDEDFEMWPLPTISAYEAILNKQKNATLIKAPAWFNAVETHKSLMLRGLQENIKKNKREKKKFLLLEAANNRSGDDRGGNAIDDESFDTIRLEVERFSYMAVKNYVIRNIELISEDKTRLQSSYDQVNNSKYSSYLSWWETNIYNVHFQITTKTVTNRSTLDPRRRGNKITSKVAKIKESISKRGNNF